MTDSDEPGDAADGGGSDGDSGVGESQDTTRGESGSDDYAADRSADPSAADQSAEPSGTDQSADSPSLTDRLPVTVGEHPLVAGVAGIVVLALVARLLALGARPAHWDEARVAYWALYAHEQGSFVYRHIVHGPFVQHTSRWLFGVVGASDTSIRLPVAVVGGLLPLSALLFRERLRDSEVLALAVLLSFNPVLLYYSRFMRSDVLVGAFMFVALGMAVRFLDSRRPRYLYGVGVFVTLGIASKENAVLYLVTWGGALVLLADRELDSPRSRTTGLQRVFRAGHRVRNAPLKTHARRYLPHAVGAALLSAVVFVFIFAPRGAGMDGIVYPPADPSSAVSLGSALTAPGEWPALLDATVSRFVEEYGAWANGADQLTIGEYWERLDGTLGAMFWAGLVTTPFAVLGFARERYGVARGRPLVMLLFFAAAASLVGYPLGLSITSGYKWNVTHVLLPLAIPAAVGLGTVGRAALETYLDEDAIGRGLLTVVILAAVIPVAGQGFHLVYENPQNESNLIVQGAQPDDDFGPLVEDLEAAAAGDGTDVLIYSNASIDGSFVRSRNVSDTDGLYKNIRPVCTVWPETLPLDWYLASTGVDADCAKSESEFRFRALDDPSRLTDRPRMIVVREGDQSVPHEELSEYYEATTYNLRFSDNTPPRAVVYVRSDVAGGA